MCVSGAPVLCGFSSHISKHSNKDSALVRIEARLFGNSTKTGGELSLRRLSRLDDVSEFRVRAWCGVRFVVVRTRINMCGLWSTNTPLPDRVSSELCVRECKRRSFCQTTNAVRLFSLNYICDGGRGLGFASHHESQSNIISP